jgi:hypothetical protein
MQCLHVEDITAEGAAQRLVDTASKFLASLMLVVNNAAWVVSSNIHTYG